MITKEQAINLQVGDRIIQNRLPTRVTTPSFSNGQLIKNYSLQNTVEISKPYEWKVNGKAKTWKTRPEEFKVPIKYGLYQFGYLTEENSHLFEVSK